MFPPGHFICSAGSRWPLCLQSRFGAGSVHYARMALRALPLLGPAIMGHLNVHVRIDADPLSWRAIADGFPSSCFLCRVDAGGALSTALAGPFTAGTRILVHAPLMTTRQRGQFSEHWEVV